MGIQQINLKQVEIKREDLTENQIKCLEEINKEIIQKVEKAEREAYQSDSPRDLADILITMAVLYSRLGTLLSDLEYEYNKVVDEGEILYTDEWLKLNDSEMAAATCNKRAEAVFDSTWRKRKRIGKWMFEKAKYYYGSLEKMIHSTNRKHDDLIVDQNSISRHQI